MPSWGLPWSLVLTRMKHFVGEMRVGCPDLTTAQPIKVAVRRGFQFQACQIRAGTWLRVALAPIVLTGQYARQIFALLCLTATAHQHRAAHVQTHGCRIRRTRFRFSIDQM